MLIEKFKKFLGLDIKEEKYAYASDPLFGYTSASKIPEKWIKTTCGYCSVGCGMLLGVKKGEIVAVRGDEDAPVNHGKLCPKGLSEHYSIKSPQRAKFPLIRDHAGLHERITWETAYQQMVERIKATQQKYGRESFAVLSTGQLVTEEFYALGKLVQLGFKTNNYDGNTTLCMSSAVVGYKQSFGSDGPPGSYQGLEKADVIFLLGANIADNHPILWHHLIKNKHGTLIVCDPRKSKTANFANIYLPIKPGKDIDLINGLIHLMIKWGKVDRAFIEAHTHGYSDLVRHAENYPLEIVAVRTGLTEEKILQTAKCIGNAQNVFFAWTMGINHSTQGSDTVSLINTLALITGNIGRTGAAPMSITGQCNAMGTREFGSTSSLPGYRKFENDKDRQELARIWRVREEEIPKKRGKNYPEIIQDILDGKIKALWVVGTNPLASFPDQQRLKAAFGKLTLLVVQDGFHPTPTTELAHLVLPAAIWGEKKGTFTNSERRVNLVQAAVNPPGEAKTDFNIFLDLALYLGVREKLFPKWRTEEDAFEEIKAVSSGRLCDYSGITYQKMLELGGIQWPCNDQNPNGKDSLYTDGVFPTEDGKARLLYVESSPKPEDPDNSYRLILNTGRTVEHWHTRTKTAAVPILEYLAPIPWLEINPQTAQYYEIRPNDKVALISRRGRVKDLVVRITETVQPGQVFLPFHYFEKCANLLTIPAFDPKSGEPNYKQCAVRIEKMPVANGAEAMT